MQLTSGINILYEEWLKNLDLRQKKKCKGMSTCFIIPNIILLLHGTDEVGHEK